MVRTVKKEVYGLDLVKFTPDYSKSAEETLKAFREAYREVFGEYPPEPSPDGGSSGKVVPLRPRSR